MAGHNDAIAASSEKAIGVLIVGTGFAGLGVAIGLARAGRRDFVLLEKADELGGTWRENTYPGCACDVPSHLYSFSFFPNPDWSRAFAPQDEILRYMHRCADHFDVRRHIRYRSEVVDAIFDDASALWRVRTSDGLVRFARHLVLGLGGLSRPAWPRIDGLDNFAGPSFHTARWRHDVPLEGRRIAVIGTGASAIQVVPRLAPVARHLDLYQRTPPWILPKPDRAFTSFEKNMFARLPLAARILRQSIYWKLEARALGFAIDPRIMAIAKRMGLKHLHAQISDPELRAKLTPDYMPGCKRILMANDYYPTLARQNVDLHTSAIRRITSDAIELADGRVKPADVIIFATGFRVTDILTPLKVIGPGGRDLNTQWAERAEAWLGTMVAGFPNLFVMTGPNTGLGHNSMIFMIESQVALILETLAQLDKRAAASVEVRADVQTAWNRDIQKRLGTSVWASGCASWYLDANGHNSTIWPGFTFDFRRRLRDFDASACIWRSGSEAFSQNQRIS